MKLIQKGTFQSPTLGPVLVLYKSGKKSFTGRIRNGIIELSVPYPTEQSEILKFLEKHKTWFLNTLKDQSKSTSGQVHLSQSDLQTLGLKAEILLPIRLSALATKFGFKYKKVLLRPLRSKWGSCSFDNRISLNTLLMLFPPHLIDYVLLHELCHTVHKNHGPHFWNLLDQCCNQSAKILRQEIRDQYSHFTF